MRKKIVWAFSVLCLCDDAIRAEMLKMLSLSVRSGPYNLFVRTILWTSLRTLVFTFNFYDQTSSRMSEILLSNKNHSRHNNLKENFLF